MRWRPPGHEPHLAPCQDRQAENGGRQKTNEKDERGLAILLRNGTLPVVWIPPTELRDEREMLRWRMCLSHIRSGVKNRIHGLLQRYNVDIAVSGLFGEMGRAELQSRLEEIPVHSRKSLLEQLVMADTLKMHIEDREGSMKEMPTSNVDRDLLESLLEAWPMSRFIMERWRGASGSTEG
jgi:hypothetical protein